MFIDGNHNGDYPLNDAKVCAKFAAEQAMILFHDLAFPEVAAGFKYLHDEGWSTRIYHTQQIMGVAWRGDVTPVNHTVRAEFSPKSELYILYYFVCRLTQSLLGPSQTT